MIDVVKHILLFVLLALLQVLVFNNMQLGGYVNPFPYIYLILILPVDIGRVQLLLAGFVLGLTVDMFCDTGGIHAAATTLVAFYRPFLLKAQSQREEYELSTVPHINVFGAGRFLTYASVMVVMHLAVLFFLEVFRMSEFFHTLFKVLMSSLFTLVIIVVAELLLFRAKRR